ncbi:hypothetical protein Pint_30499 [Pistacia integerrima]|uniref:Uncharacterized protein n=1 Tax=Pistacia integerrima TaxID=434235 RepID=A0ACC0X028_9ROSI|nr:hypothetical protein Pint_30499 [Pistacia integerrima]
MLWQKGREQILKLYRDYYHGGLMKLVVIGGGPIWKAGKLYRLEAVKDVHILDLTWTLPCLRQDYLKKPEDYLAHLMGHGKIFLVAAQESAYLANCFNRMEHSEKYPEGPLRFKGTGHHSPVCAEFEKISCAEFRTC